MERQEGPGPKSLSVLSAELSWGRSRRDHLRIQCRWTLEENKSSSVTAPNQASELGWDVPRSPQGRSRLLKPIDPGTFQDGYRTKRGVSYYGQHCASFRAVPDHSIAAFLRRPAAYYQPADRHAMYARNSLVYDLGGDPNRDPADEAYLQAFILGLESVFSLVMVAEHFDESLVLLRRLLAWDLDDVTYVRLNARSEASRSRLAGDLPDRARGWNWLDTRLYRHFNATLWRKLRGLGLECVERELGLLRQANRRLARACFGGGAEPPARQASQIEDADLRPWQPSRRVSILGYQLPRNLSLPPLLAASCLRLITPEISYSRQLLRKAAMRVRVRGGTRPTTWGPRRAGYGERSEAPRPHNKQSINQSTVTIN
ncbi:galactose-3-O-sulfotransferase 3-like [Heptranchias perlo]|uniref:galactose-3-O-sulfotransferase 3-like n=1 Tax=Heptranchias perlo TaxID=212740 RepID=UPI0035593C8F